MGPLLGLALGPALPGEDRARGDPWCRGQAEAQGNGPSSSPGKIGAQDAVHTTGCSIFCPGAGDHAAGLGSPPQAKQRKRSL